MDNRTNNQASNRGLVRRLGFSMMDLMVSIAVIAILIAVLMPALTSAMESARRVKCQTHLLEYGRALTGYITDHQEQLPETVHARYTTYNGVLYPRHEQTLYLRLPETSMALRQTDGWDGLGLLYHTPRSAGYLNVSDIAYCPSHAGDHTKSRYSRDWIAQEGTVAGNYQYRLPIYANRVQELDPAMALVSVGLREKTDYNHKVGNNLLKADISISWFDDTSRKVYSGLLEDGNDADARFAVAQAWGRLDNDPKRPVSNPSVPRDHQEDAIFASIHSPSTRR